jgi:OOP family OmpA-OmpF porin
MRKLVFSLAFVLLAAGLASTPAEAGFNVGASYTDTTVEETGNFKADDNNYKIFAGWRFFERQWFGVEAQYVDFGKFSDQGTNAEATGFGVYALVSLKLWRFDLFGKAGVSSWDTKISTDPDEDGTDPSYGVGVAFRITQRLYVRAEWETFEFDKADADMASLGVDFRF